MIAIAMVLGALVFGLLSARYGADSRFEFDGRTPIS